MFYIICTILAFIVGIGGGITLCMSAMTHKVMARWNNGVRCMYQIGDSMMIITEIQEINTEDNNAVFAIVERR